MTIDRKFYITHLVPPPSLGSPAPQRETLPSGGRRVNWAPDLTMNLSTRPATVASGTYELRLLTDPTLQTGSCDPSLQASTCKCRLWVHPSTKLVLFSPGSKLAPVNPGTALAPMNPGSRPKPVAPGQHSQTQTPGQQPRSQAPSPHQLPDWLMAPGSRPTPVPDQSL